MDNRHFQNAIHVIIAQHSNDDVGTEDMPELVPLDAPGSHTTEPQTTDVEMNGEGSDMPSLMSFSGSDGDYDDSESDRDAHEVEMQTVNDHRLNDNAVPNPFPTSHTTQDQPTINNRRARVEDDEDEDRDRRHPSQRVGNSPNVAPSTGPLSATPVLPPSRVPAAASLPTRGVHLQGQAPIFNRTAVDEAATARAHPFRFFQHLMSNNNINSGTTDDAGSINPVPPSGGPVPAPQPHQDGNTPNNQPQGRHPTIIEGFSVTLDIGLGPTFHVGGGAQQTNGEPTSNAADPNLITDPNGQNGLPPNASFADLMARFGLFGQAGLGGNGAEGTTGAPAPGGGNNPNQGGAGATPGAQFGFNFPGGFNLANLAGLGFGFNLDGSGFAEKEDPERARKLVDGLEEVPVGLVRRLERVGGTGGGMGEDETKGGDGGCAICWDRLLFGYAEEDLHQHGESVEKQAESERTQPETSTNGDGASKRSTAKIVSLPCAHVFHAECLIPWFSRPRQTTCPTCRFNIDPENLTYVSWRRRMRERRERERGEARARDEPEETNGGESVRNESAPPPTAAATAAGPAVANVPPEQVISSEQILSLLTSLPLRSRTPDASVLNVRPTQAPRSQSQPPSFQVGTSSSSSSSSGPAPSTSQPTIQSLSAHEGEATYDADTHVSAQVGVDHWDAMPGLQDVSDSDDDEDDDDDDDEGDEAQEQGDGMGVQDTPVLPRPNEPLIVSGAQAQAPRPGQNDPVAPRMIQTAHGLVTLFPVPFSFAFPSAINGVGVGVQTGGNAANAQVPGQTQGQPPNANNTNANMQAPLPGFPLGHPLGLAFPHFHVQLPPMPEFGAQRGPQPAAPVPANAPANAPANNANPGQTVLPNPFVDDQEAAAITNNEAQLMQHLLSQGFTPDEAEAFRRSTATGRLADRLRRGEDPVALLDLENEGEDDVMMGIDEGMGMVVDLTMEQGGTPGVGGVGPGADPAATTVQDREEFAQILDFLNNTTRHAWDGNVHQGTQGAAGGVPSDAQPQPQQPQGPGLAPFMAGLNAGFNIGNHLGAGDGRTMNEFFAQLVANLTGVPQQQPRQQAQGQNAGADPQAQAQSQVGQEPAEVPNPTNDNNNDGRPRQPAQFAFGNVTISPFRSWLDQNPIFNGAAGVNINGGAGTGQERVKKAWTLPPAPGPTLRQRIERRERDAGLRCFDVSCGIGPSDEDPAASDDTVATGLRQLIIMSKSHCPDGNAEGACTHTFHPGCLVSAERVALGGADVSVIEGGDVEVSCPVCRSTGCVTKQQWDEGVSSLA